jgi:hypothetical protein
LTLTTPILEEPQVSTPALTHDLYQNDRGCVLTAGSPPHLNLAELTGC